MSTTSQCYLHTHRLGRMGVYILATKNTNLTVKYDLYQHPYIAFHIVLHFVFCPPGLNEIRELEKGKTDTQTV